jgi:hypothetical protein
MAEYNFQFRGWHALVAIAALVGFLGFKMFLRLRSVDDEMRDAGSCRSWLRMRIDTCVQAAHSAGKKMLGRPSPPSVVQPLCVWLRDA